jgi:hypothetical protein
MNLKTRKPLQVGAISLALTMLASYVVYSQRQGSQNVAPGSKSGAIDIVPDKAALQQQTASTNRPLHRSLTVVAPSSKSMSPVLAVPAASSKTTKIHVTNAPSPMVFPGSKSAAVFHPQDVTVLMPQTAPARNSFPAPLPHPNETKQYSTFSAGTNAAATLSLKP